MSEQPSNPSGWESNRWAKFQKKLEKIHRSNSFQKKRFPGLADWKSWQGFDDFSTACPLTTKKELEADRLTHLPLGTNLTFEQEHYTRFSRTSGTCGDAIAWMDTSGVWKWML